MDDGSSPSLIAVSLRELIRGGMNHAFEAVDNEIGKKLAEDRLKDFRQIDLRSFWAPVFEELAFSSGKFPQLLFRYADDPLVESLAVAADAIIRRAKEMRDPEALAWCRRNLIEVKHVDALDSVFADCEEPELQRAFLLALKTRRCSPHLSVFHKIGQPAVGPLLAIATDPASGTFWTNPATREAACRMLLKIDANLFETISGLLPTADPGVRRAILSSFVEERNRLTRQRARIIDLLLLELNTPCSNECGRDKRCTHKVMAYRMLRWDDFDPEERERVIQAVRLAESMEKDPETVSEARKTEQILSDLPTQDK